MSASKHILRFVCGAESPPFEGSFPDWVKCQIKAHKGHAVGRQRHDGRYRVVTWDLNGGIIIPRMPNGEMAPCLSCPCAKEAGRRELKAKPLDPRHGRRIVVTCYPEETCLDQAIEAAIDDATRKVASATPDVAPATLRVAEPVRNDQERRSCFIHGDFAGLDCPKCPVRNDRRGRA